MKKKIIIILLSSTLAACTLYAQTFTIGMEGGQSFGKAPIFGFNLGLNFKDFNIRTGLDEHANAAIIGGTVFKTTLGHTFNIGEKYYITAAAGHAYLLKSMDRKELNRSEFLINPEIGYKWEFKGQAMGTYLSYSHAGDINMITVGIRGLFGNCEN